MSKKDQCQLRLQKLEPIYFCYEEDLGDAGQRRWVMYKEKGHVKYGYIQGVFYKRYGISVVAILKSGHPKDLWQIRSGAINDEEFEYMMEFMVGGSLDFPVLDLDNLEYEL